MARRTTVKPALWRLAWLVGLLALCLLVGRIGSLLTTPQLGTWYRDLVKPSFTPPDIAFPVVWTVLYLLMAVAAWRVAIRADGRSRAIALAAFLVQLGLNLSWSYAFFAERSPLGGLVVIALLIATIAATIALFAPIDRIAAWLLAPYLLWVGYAAVLNAAILVLNP